jgi:hypothetical protein
MLDNLDVDMSTYKRFKVEVIYLLTNGRKYIASYNQFDIRDVPYISYDLIPNSVLVDVEQSQARLDAMMNETFMDDIKKNWKEIVWKSIRFAAILTAIVFIFQISYNYGALKVTDNQYEQNNVMYPTIQKYMKDNILSAEQTERNMIIKTEGDKLYRVFLDGGDEYLIQVGDVNSETVTIDSVVEIQSR